MLSKARSFRGETRKSKIGNERQLAIGESFVIAVYMEVEYIYIFSTSLCVRVSTNSKHKGCPQVVLFVSSSLNDIYPFDFIFISFI